VSLPCLSPRPTPFSTAAHFSRPLPLPLPLPLFLPLSLSLPLSLGLGLGLVLGLAHQCLLPTHQQEQQEQQEEQEEQQGAWKAAPRPCMHLCPGLRPLPALLLASSLPVRPSSLVPWSFSFFSFYLSFFSFLSFLSFFFFSFFL